MLNSIQASYSPEIEVIVLKDDFELPIGAKRNMLLEKANGSWSAFVDDDDLVSPVYCKLILHAIKRYPNIDQVGFKLKMFENGVYRNKPTYHCLMYCKKMDWYTTNRGYFRPTTHLNPMRIDLARSVRFPEISRGEDQEWAKAIIDSGNLVAEHFIDQFLYFYYVDSRTSASVQGKQAKKLQYPIKPIKMPVTHIYV